MSDLLKHLEERDDASIPLLRDEINDGDEEIGLFTEEELQRISLKKRIITSLKLILPLLIIFIILIGLFFKIYHNISFNWRNQKVEYKLNSISLEKGSENGFNFSLNATVDTKIPWSFDLKGLSIDVLKNGDVKNNLNLDDDVIVNTKVPDFKLISGELIPITLENQTISIKNPKYLAKLINNAIETKKAKIPLRITTKIHAHWIPFTKNLKMIETVFIDLNNRKFVEGDFIKLKDLKMEESFNDNLIITAKIVMTNPFPISIDEIPRVSFQVYSKDKIFIGIVKVIESNGFKKGDNQFILQGNVNTSNNPKSSDAIGELISNHLIGKSSKIYLQGNDDEDEQIGEKFNWIKSILIHLNIPIEIPGSSGSGGMFEDSIKRIDIKRVLFSLNPEKPNQIELDSDAEVHFNIPRIASFIRPKIESLSLEGKLHDERGNFISQLSLPNHFIGSHFSKENSLKTSLKMDIKVNSLNIQNVEGLMSEMLQSQDTTTVNVSGHSSVKTKMMLGKITIPSVPFTADIKLPSLGSILSSQKPEIKDLKLIEISEKELKLEAKILIENPTEITSLMGTIQLDCIPIDSASTFASDVNLNSAQSIGTALMKNVSIHPGKNELKCELQFKRNDPKVEEFLNRYISGKEQFLLLKGLNGSDLVHPILKNVIGSFVMKSSIIKSKGTFGKFVTAITLKRRKGFNINILPEAFMTVNNPFNFPIKILSVKDLNVFAYKSSGEAVLITEMDKVPLEEPIVIPGNVENWLDEETPLPLQINGNILRSLKALEMLLSKENPKDSNGKTFLPIRIEGKIRSEMAGMELNFQFIKDRLPMYFETGF